jgi:DnaJ-class molecular chaperone
VADGNENSSPYPLIGRDAYKLLGVPEDAPIRPTIREAYRTLVKEAYSENTPTGRAHAEKLTAALEVLSNPDARAEYNAYLRNETSHSQTVGIESRSVGTPEVSASNQESVEQIPETYRSFGRDGYKLLGVSEDASLKEIKSAYKALAKECWSDTKPLGKAHFEKLTQVFEVMSDQNKRAAYNAYLHNETPHGGASPAISELEAEHTQPSALADDVVKQRVLATLEAANDADINGSRDHRDYRRTQKALSDLTNDSTIPAEIIHEAIGERAASLRSRDDAKHAYVSKVADYLSEMGTTLTPEHISEARTHRDQTIFKTQFEREFDVALNKLQEASATDIQKGTGAVSTKNAVESLLIKGRASPAAYEAIQENFAQLYPHKENSGQAVIAKYMKGVTEDLNAQPRLQTGTSPVTISQPEAVAKERMTTAPVETYEQILSYRNIGNRAYEILGVAETTSPAEIKQGYQKMDGLHSDWKSTMEWKEAYAKLGTPQARTQYDADLRADRTYTTLENLGAPPSVPRQEFADYMKKKGVDFANVADPLVQKIDSLNNQRFISEGVTDEFVKELAKDVVKDVRARSASIKARPAAEASAGPKAATLNIGGDDDVMAGIAKQRAQRDSAMELLTEAHKKDITEHSDGLHTDQAIRNLTKNPDYSPAAVEQAIRAQAKLLNDKPILFSGAEGNSIRQVLDDHAIKTTSSFITDYREQLNSSANVKASQHATPDSKRGHRPNNDAEGLGGHGKRNLVGPSGRERGAVELPGSETAGPATTPQNMARLREMQAQDALRVQVPAASALEPAAAEAKLSASAPREVAPNAREPVEASKVKSVLAEPETPSSNNHNRTGQALGLAGVANRTEAIAHNKNMSTGEKALSGVGLVADTAATFSKENGGKYGAVGSTIGVLSDTYRGYKEDGAKGAVLEGGKGTIDAGIGLAVFLDQGKNIAGGTRPQMGGVSGFAGKAALVSAAVTTANDTVDYISGKKELNTQNYSQTTVDVVTNFDPVKAVTSLTSVTKLVGVDTGIQNVSIGTVVDRLEGGKGEAPSAIMQETAGIYKSLEDSKSPKEIPVAARMEKADPDKPSFLDYKHLAGLKYLAVEHIPGGKIDGHDVATEFDKIDWSNGHNRVAYMAGLHKVDAALGNIMEKNASILPDWMRSNASLNAYNNAMESSSHVQAAIAEVGKFEERLMKYNAEHGLGEQVAFSTPERKIADLSPQEKDKLGITVANLDLDKKLLGTAAHVEKPEQQASPANRNPRSGPSARPV